MSSPFTLKRSRSDTSPTSHTSAAPASPNLIELDSPPPKRVKGVAWASPLESVTVLAAAPDHVTAAEPSAEAIGPRPVTGEREALDILKDIIPIPASTPAATTKGAQTTAGLPAPLNLEAPGRAASLSGGAPLPRSRRDRTPFRPTSRRRPTSGDEGVPPLEARGPERADSFCGRHRRTSSAPTLIETSNTATHVQLPEEGEEVQGGRRKEMPVNTARQNGGHGEAIAEKAVLMPTARGGAEASGAVEDGFPENNGVDPAPNKQQAEHRTPGLLAYDGNRPTVSPMEEHNEHEEHNGGKSSEPGAEEADEEADEEAGEEEKDGSERASARQIGIYFALLTGTRNCKIDLKSAVSKFLPKGPAQRRVDRACSHAVADIAFPFPLQKLEPYKGQKSLEVLLRVTDPSVRDIHQSKFDSSKVRIKVMDTKGHLLFWFSRDDLTDSGKRRLDETCLWMSQVKEDVDAKNRPGPPLQRTPATAPAAPGAARPATRNVSRSAPPRPRSHAPGPAAASAAPRSAQGASRAVAPSTRVTRSSIRQGKP